MRDKRKYIKKVLTQERKEKVGINQQNCSQTNGRANLLNLTKVHIIIKGNGSVNMIMEKGAIIMNITMMNLITTDKSSGIKSHNNCATRKKISYL